MERILSLLFLLSCQNTPINQRDITSVLSFNYIIEPGSVKKITFRPSYTYSGKLYCRDKNIPFVRDDDLIIAYVAETYFTNFSSFNCIYHQGTTKQVVAKFNVIKKDFPSERLNVDKRRIFLSKKNRERVLLEQKFLNKNYFSSPSYPLFSKSFEVPIKSDITSIYGVRRIFNNKKRTQHLGTDYRADIGTAIYASNAGRVVVARELFYTGYTVTIDHGLSIFTIYGHLSRLNVSEGDIISKGETIGLSGATGRVTGPHLHWGVKVGGHFIDGDTLIKETAWLDKHAYHP